MSETTWDDLLDVEPEGSELVPTVAQPTAAPQEEDWMASFLQKQERDEAELPRKRADYVRFVTSNPALPPDRHAEILRLSTATGLGMDYVRDNYELVKSESHAAGIDWHDIVTTSPVTARWLADPDNNALVRDDIYNASTLEWWLGSGGVFDRTVERARDYLRGVFTAGTLGGDIGAALDPSNLIMPQDTISLRNSTPGALKKSWGQGVLNLAIANASYEAGRRGVDPLDDPTVKAYKAQVVGDLGEENRGFLGRTAVGFLSNIPFSIEAIGEAGLLGALSQYVAKRTRSPYVAVAAQAGGALGAFNASRRFEAGLAYLQYAEDARMRGVKFDVDLARNAADLVGVINGMQELASDAVLYKFIARSPYVRKAVTGLVDDEGVKLLGADDILRKPSISRGVMQSLVAATTSTGVEALTEAGQSIVTDIGAASMRQQQGEEFDLTGAREKAYAEFEGALIAFWPMGLLSIAGPIHQEIGRKQLADRQFTRLMQTHRIMQESKLRQRDVEKTVELGERLMQAEATPQYVYVRLDKWDEGMAERHLTGEEGARVLTGSDEAYQSALREANGDKTKADIAIPFSEWIGRIASNVEGQATLLKGARLSQDMPYLADFEQVQNEITKLMEVPTSEYTEGQGRLYEMYRSQIPSTTKITEEQADHASRLFVSQMTRLAVRAGYDNAYQFWIDENYRLNIKAEKDAESASHTMRQQQMELGRFRNSDAFLSWWKASKAVDERGEPLVVYHGTGAYDIFTEFRTTREGAHFSVDPNVASSLTGDWQFDHPNDIPNPRPSRVYPAMLSIQNPVRLRDHGIWSPGIHASDLVAAGVATFDEVYAAESLQALLKAKGYDGIVYLNRYEIRDASGAPVGLQGMTLSEHSDMSDAEFLARVPEARDSYIAFAPEQIKSPFNVGTFSKDQPSIYLQSAMREWSEREAEKTAHNAEWEPPRSQAGKVKGGPEHVNDHASKSAITVAHRKNENLQRQLAEEGRASRFWYQESALAVLDMLKGDFASAEKFIQLLAIYSADTGLWPNTMFAVRAWTQWKAGVPWSDFHVSVGKLDEKAVALLYRGQAWSGRKTNSFYVNMVSFLYGLATPEQRASMQLDQEALDAIGHPVTADVWMGRANGYEIASFGGRTAANTDKYGYVEGVTSKIAAEVGWLPMEGQASIWTAMVARWNLPSVKEAALKEQIAKGLVTTLTEVNEKTGRLKITNVIPKENTPQRIEYEAIRRKHALAADPHAVAEAIRTESMSFASTLEGLTHQFAFEAIPAEQLGASIVSAPYAAKAEFTRQALSVVADLPSLFGIPLARIEPSDGYWGGTGNPNFVMTVTTDKEAGAFDPAMANQVSAALGYVLNQNEVYWWRPEYLKEETKKKKSKTRKRAAELWLSSPLDASELSELGTRLMAAAGVGFTVQPDGKSITIINSNDELSPEAFDAKVDEAAGEFANVERIEGYNVQAGLAKNDWVEAPDGGQHLDAIKKAPPEGGGWSRQPDLLSQLADRRRQFEYLLASFDTHAYSSEQRLGSDALAGVRADVGPGSARPDRRPPEGARHEVSAAPSFAANTPHEKAISVYAVHYSPLDGLRELDPTFAGTGSAGGERRRFGLGRFGQRGGTAARINFYAMENGSIPQPEHAVDGNHVYVVKLNNVYDLRVDPLKLAAGLPSSNIDALEEKIAAAGFDGLIATPGPGMHAPHVAVFNAAGKTIPVIQLVRGKARYAQRVFQGSPAQELEGGQWDDYFIGSGEDTMGQGAGHYFSSKKAVAEWYYRTLARMRRGVLVRGVRRASSDISGMEDAAERLAALAVLETGWHEAGADNVRAALTHLAPYNWPGTSSSILKRAADLIVSGEVAASTTGNVFEAEIPEDDELADWNLALEDQPELEAKLKAASFYDAVVKHVAREMAIRPKQDRDLAVEQLHMNSFEEFYNALAETFMGDGKSSNKAKRMASEALRDVGIPGHVYRSRSGNKNYVIYDPRRASFVKRYYQEEGEARGFITFVPGERTFDITLLQGADVSTLVHETAHFLLNVMGDIASGGKATEESVKDYGAILTWLGYKDHADRTRSLAEATSLRVAPKLTAKQRARLAELDEREEKFARGWETYLWEGRPPTAELARPFALFRAWLTKVGRTATALAAPLTPEVRDVFDRLVATEEALAEARQQTPHEPSQEAMGAMTDAERERYAKAAQEAIREPEDALRAKVMAHQQRTLARWFKDEREEIANRIREGLLQTPAHRALWWFQRGEMPNGAEAPAVLLSPQGAPLRLSGTLLKEFLTQAQLAVLRSKRIYQATGGVSDEVASLALGFKSGAQLIDALLHVERLEDVVARETEAEIQARYPDLLKDMKAMADASTLAVLGDARAEQLMIELRALARVAGKDSTASFRPADVKTLREAAKLLVESRRLAQIDPGYYLRRVQAEARRAAISKTAVTRYDALQAELWNMQLYRAATKAVEEIESVREYADSFDSLSKRQKIGKAGPSYVDAANEILIGLHFKRETERTAQRRISLRDWVETQLKDEVSQPDVIIAAWMLDGKSLNHSYRELTLSELREVRDALKNIEHLAGLKNTILTTQKKRHEATVVIPELVGSIRSNMPFLGAVTHSRTIDSDWQRRVNAIKAGGATLHKIEELVRRMDGGKVNGPWARHVWNPIAEAEVAERDLMLALVQKLTESIETMPEAIRANLRDQVYSERIGQSYTRADILVIALNTGNASNLQKLLAGQPRRTRTWDAQAIKELVDHLTTEEMDFVQGVWNTLGSLWPMIYNLEERLTGVGPAKIAPQAFTFKGKEYAGGYYPLRYDPRFLPKAESDSLMDASKGYVRAVTPHGHVKDRIETFAAPILLDLNVIPAHLTAVVHDLTHREALLSINKLLHNPEVHLAMLEHLGEGDTAQFTDWLRGLANDQNYDQSNAVHVATKISRWSRRNAAVVALGLKASMFWQNFMNIVGAVDQVKSRHLMKGVQAFYTDREAMVAFVKGLSGEMRHRFNMVERDVREVVLKSMIDPKHAQLAKVRRYASYMTAVSDAAVAYPVWLGGYYQGLEDGLSEVDAVAFADRSVRLTLGGAGQKDLANIQRNNEALKWLTTFYSFFSVQYNQLSRIKYDLATTRREGGTIRDFSMILARTIATFGAQALLAELIVGRGPDEDEPYWRWIARKTVLFPFLTVPGLREGAVYVENQLLGGRPRDISFGQIEPVIKNIGGALASDIELLAGDDELDAALVKKNIRAAGYLSGLPVSQFIITGEYLWDLEQGDEDPETFWELWRNVQFSRRRDKR